MGRLLRGLLLPIVSLATASRTESYGFPRECILCGCDRVVNGRWLGGNLRAIHTFEISLLAQVSSLHRFRGYERLLVATALFATLGITGLAVPANGDDGHMTVGPIGILGIPEETAQLVA